MKILFVQEQSGQLSAIKLTLQKKGYGIVVCNGSLHAKTVIDAVHPDMVIADITKEKRLRYVEEAKNCNVPVMALNAQSNEAVLQQVFENAADDYLSSPVSLTELVMQVNLLSKELMRHAT